MIHGNTVLKAVSTDRLNTAMPQIGRALFSELLKCEIR
jgi:hypothetical protein